MLVVQDKKGLVRGTVVLALLLALAFIGPGGPLPRLVRVWREGGEGQQVWTSESLVGDILAQAGICLTEYERVYPEPEEEVPAANITITRAKEVTLSREGREETVLTWAGTVAALLAEQGINPNEGMLSCPLEQELFWGLRVQIVRVETELVREEVLLSAPTVYQDDASLERGKTKVETQARSGRKLVTYEVRRHDGEEAARRLVEEEILTSPVAGVILRGTRTISRGGGEAVLGLASYYGSELHGRKTASGVPFDMNALTAAHRTLPFGTRVKVTYLATGKSVVVVINDRGPFVAGRIIDLSAAAAKAIGLYAAGVGKVRLEIP